MARIWLDARPGMKAPNAKLDDEKVRAIRREYFELPLQGKYRRLGVAALAKKYGVSVTRISQVALFKSWRHVS